MGVNEERQICVGEWHVCVSVCVIFENVGDKGNIKEQMQKRKRKYWPY